MPNDLKTLLQRTHLIFDLDGTLIDPWAGAWMSLKHAFESQGLTPPDENSTRWIVGPPIADSIDKLLTGRPQEVRHAVWKAFRESYDTKGWEMNSIYDGVEDLLAIAHVTQKKIYIASSKPEPGPEAILKQYGIHDFFTGVFGARTDEGRKTKSDVLNALFSRHEIPREDAVMIGDRHHDVEGAGEFGIPTIGVLWGYGSRTELKTARAASLVMSPQELSLAINSAR